VVTFTRTMAHTSANASRVHMTFLNSLDIFPNHSTFSNPL